MYVSINECENILGRNYIDRKCQLFKCIVGHNYAITMLALFIENHSDGLFYWFIGGIMTIFKLALRDNAKNRKNNPLQVDLKSLLFSKVL